jgi:thiamine-monophosphate kinase
MISGGEDYELLFTAAPADSEKLLKLITPYDYGIYPVGTIVREQGVSLIRDPGTKGYGHERNISYQGYDHFTTS